MTEYVNGQLNDITVYGKIKEYIGVNKFVVEYKREGEYKTILLNKESIFNI